jgi:hypothetical protein
VDGHDLVVGVHDAAVRLPSFDAIVRTVRRLCVAQGDEAPDPVHHRGLTRRCPEEELTVAAAPSVRMGISTL